MESKWGLIPDMSGSVLLRELTSISTAKEVKSLRSIVVMQIPRIHFTPLNAPFDVQWSGPSSR